MVGTNESRRSATAVPVVEIGTYTIRVGNNTFDITSFEGRMGARACAYALAADGYDAEFKQIIDAVGREG